MSEAQMKASKIVAALGGTATAPTAPGGMDAGPTVSECSRKFLEYLEPTVRDSTRAMHKKMLLDLAEFCATNSISHVRKLNVVLCDEFIESIGRRMKRSSLRTCASKFRKFIAWCERKGHITDRLADRLEPVAVTDWEPANPYAEEEVRALIGATKKTDSMLLELMTVSGLRISDALQFDPGRCSKDGEQMVYRFAMQKNRKTKQIKWSDAWLPTDLYNRIMQSRAEWAGALPFIKSKGPYHSAYRRMDRVLKDLGEQLGIADARCHRFRDYFAVDLLTRGVSIGDVSTALHHSSVVVTEKHYAAWIPARAKRLGAVLAAARKEVA